MIQEVNRGVLLFEGKGYHVVYDAQHVCICMECMCNTPVTPHDTATHSITSTTPNHNQPHPTTTNHTQPHPTTTNHNQPHPTTPNHTHRFYNDLWEFVIADLKWHPLGRPDATRPSPRGGCQLALHGTTLFVIGGYTATLGGGEDEGGDSGKAHNDVWAWDIQEGVVWLACLDVHMCVCVCGCVCHVGYC